MMNKMMEFSLEKMGIEYRIKRGRKLVLLNFDFEIFLKWMNSSNAVGFLLHFGLFLYDSSAWIMCEKMLEV